MYLIEDFKKCNHISRTLEDLHLLPIQGCIVYKNCFLCAAAMNKLLPSHSQAEKVIISGGHRITRSQDMSRTDMENCKREKNWINAP